MTVPSSPHEPADPHPGSDPSSRSGAAPQGTPGRYGQPAPHGTPAQAGHPAAVRGPLPGTDLASDLGAAMKFAGNALLRNPVSYLVVGLIYSVIIGVLIFGGIAAGITVMISRMHQWQVTEPAGTVPMGEILLFYAGFFAVALLAVPFALLWQSGSARAAEVILEGGRPTIRQALIGSGRVLLTALLVGAITLVGTLLLYIPGLVAAVALVFAVPAAARGASPVEAVKESFQLAGSNLATTIVTYLILSVIASVAGSLIIPLLVVLPFSLLFELGMYERLKGRELPDPARGA
ncbi:hypothetical protein [Brachybacterium sp. GCM10030252]|uniref:hypothetical protein n=1 Tax=Brachybacterium sp. GCM10030252 TaxID=3273380 RepID=UPI00361341D6